MLKEKECLEILKTYNINSKKYEPTIYINNHDIGLCLEIKDSLFGYLTRLFIFNTLEELDNFLKKYFWYKENHQKYNITLSLDNYETKTPTIFYKYQDKELTLDEMLHIDDYLNEDKLKKEEERDKNFYLQSIHEITNYLINLKKLKINNQKEKNNLKTEENDLKFALLKILTLYYGREKELTKKEIILDKIDNTNDTLLIKNEENIKTKPINEIKDYLNILINATKEEELDEKNLINIYSISVYHYNIDILKKQIEFVKNKIEAEKNFNLKGSKLHNIDEELRSFLKTNIAPTKIEVFLKENKDKINAKFNNITLDNASLLITGKEIHKPPKEEPTSNNLEQQFLSLDEKVKNSLILYHSIYKPICDAYLNHTSQEDLKQRFDFKHYYDELKRVVYNENNYHYLVKYFKYIKFKNLDTYISSIIEIANDIEKTTFTLTKPITLFANNTKDIYKKLYPSPNKNSKYILNVSNNIIYLPTKLKIDFDNEEISLIKDEAYYIKSDIIEDIESITLQFFHKQEIEKDNYIITTDLIKDEKIILNKSHIGGNNHE